MGHAAYSTYTIGQLARTTGVPTSTVRYYERIGILHQESIPAIATGRRPNTDTIAIERAGVVVSPHGKVLVDAHLRTNVPHIFAAGDVIGRQTGSQMATPVGSPDGGAVVLRGITIIV